MTVIVPRRAGPLQRRFAPVQRCIYCQATKDLTDEHIVPASLGGLLVLPKASCPKCQDKTKRFEQIVTRSMYWPLRLRLGIQGSRKRRKKRPTHWPVEIVDEKGNVEMGSVEVGKLPIAYVVPRFPLPSYRSGAPHERDNPAIDLDFKGNDADLKRYAEELGAGRSEFTFTFQWGPFARLIAKVGHCYAVATLGMDGIEFFLPEMITDDHAYISKFVGCATEPERQLPSDVDLATSLLEIDGEILVIAHMTFFGNGRFPTYEAIVGRVIDRDLVANRISGAGLS